MSNPNPLARSIESKPRLLLLRAALLAAAFLVAALLTAFAFIPASAQQEMPAMLPPDPDMPHTEGFDPDRAIFWETPNFVPLRNPDWVSLADALEAGDVEGNTPVLKFSAGGRTVALVTSQMAYHHVAQGEMAGEPWMVTF